MQDFYEFVRGQSEHNAYGKGAHVYRFLVRLGVDEILRDSFPQVVDGLSQEDWDTLINAFIAQSRWESPYVNELQTQFIQYLTTANLSGTDVPDSSGH